MLDTRTNTTAYSKLNNIIPEVTQSGDSLVVPSHIKVLDATLLSFRSPCDCSEVSTISIAGEKYDLVDASHSSVTGRGAFTADAMVTVLIDPTSHRAYIQNSASSNSNGSSNISSGREDLIDGESELATNDIYLVY